MLFSQDQYVLGIGKEFLKRYWILQDETNLVAAKTNTPVKTSTPSNSVRNCTEGIYKNKEKEEESMK